MTLKAQQGSDEGRSPLPQKHSGLFVLVDLLFSRYALAGLVPDRATRFASGLAGASALAATRYFFFLGFCYRLDHVLISRKFFLIIQRQKKFCKYFFILSSISCREVRRIPPLPP